MAIADKPSVVTMPPDETRFDTVLQFLVWKFSGIPENQWQQRMLNGKVLWDDQTAIAVDARYAPHQRIFYFREVAEEPVIPFTEEIVYQDDHLLVVCKPHFLPVVPGGRYVQECLLNRLRCSTGINDLAPIHRLDRETAGLLMLSVNPETRGAYHDLFMHRRIHKIYHAVAYLGETRPLINQQWKIENRLVTGEPKFRVKVVEGKINARSKVRCLSVLEGRGLFELEPVSGKRHQLRVHMSELGMPLVNDRYYPQLQDKTDDNFQTPLQLLAKSLRFVDPVSGAARYFESNRKLMFGGA